MSTRGCSHLDAIAIESIKQPHRRECEECVKIGSYWVHLRTCQTWSHAVLRQLTESARQQARARQWTSCDRIGAAGGELVVLLSR